MTGDDRAQGGILTSVDVVIRPISLNDLGHAT